jgi:hypothetical protein
MVAMVAVASPQHDTPILTTETVAVPASRHYEQESHHG